MDASDAGYGFESANDVLVGHHHPNLATWPAVPPEGALTLDDRGEPC
jgi:hypothetical protein